VLFYYFFPVSCQQSSSDPSSVIANFQHYFATVEQRSLLTPRARQLYRRRRVSPDPARLRHATTCSGTTSRHQRRRRKMRQPYDNSSDLLGSRRRLKLNASVPRVGPTDALANIGRTTHGRVASVGQRYTTGTDHPYWHEIRISSRTRAAPQLTQIPDLNDLSLQLFAQRHPALRLLFEVAPTCPDFVPTDANRLAFETQHHVERLRPTRLEADHRPRSWAATGSPNVEYVADVVDLDVGTCPP